MPKKIDCSKLLKPSLANNFAIDLDKQVKECTVNHDIESSWKSLRDAIYNTSADLLGFPSRKNQDWFALVLKMRKENVIQTTNIFGLTGQNGLLALKLVTVE